MGGEADRIALGSQGGNQGVSTTKRPLAPALQPSAYALSLSDRVRAVLGASLFSGVVGLVTFAIAAPWAPLAIAMGGLIGLAMAGSILDNASSDFSYDHPNLTLAINLGAAVAAGAATASVGPLVPAGLLAAGIFSQKLQENAEEAVLPHELAVDERATSGAYRTAELFRDAIRRTGASPHLEAELKALEALEQSGWRCTATLGQFEEHCRARWSHRPLFVGPDDERVVEGRARHLGLSVLPLLAGLAGVAPLPDQMDAEQVSRLLKCVDQQIHVTGYEALRDDGKALCREARLVDLAETMFCFSSHLADITVGKDGLYVPLSDLGKLDLATAVESAATFIDGCQRQSPELAKVLSKGGANNCEGLVKAFRAQPEQERETFFGVLDTLARAGAHSREARAQGGLVRHYDAMLAACDPGVPLAQSASEYAALLSAWATVGHVDDVPALYAAIREAVVADAGGETFDVRAQRALSVLASGGTPEDARNAALRPPVNVSVETIEKGADVVRIGGVAVPVHH